MEKSCSAKSGYLFVFIEVLFLAFAIFGFTRGMVVPAIALVVIFFVFAVGFMIVDPNQSAVLVLFGAYKGTVKKNGFFWVNPLFW